MAERAQPAPHMLVHREVDPDSGLSPPTRVYLRGWLTLGLMFSPTFLAGAVTFLVLH